MEFVCANNTICTHGGIRAKSRIDRVSLSDLVIHDSAAGDRMTDGPLHRTAEPPRRPRCLKNDTQRRQIIFSCSERDRIDVVSAESP